jgi:hypothetical protein
MSADRSLSNKLEDVGTDATGYTPSFNDDGEVFLCSIAISLKRIADALESIPTKMEGMPIAIEQAIWSGLRGKS